MVAGPTGLHAADQRLIYKGRERDSKCFLDSMGVRDGSKIVVVEDEVSRERRCLESRKSATLDKASKEIAAIRFDVDSLADQVMIIFIFFLGGYEGGYVDRVEFFRFFKVSGYSIWAD